MRPMLALTRNRLFFVLIIDVNTGFYALPCWNNSIQAFYIFTKLLVANKKFLLANTKVSKIFNRCFDFCSRLMGFLFLGYKYC